MAGLRIDIADLLSHPGARREVSVEAELDALRGSAATVEGPIRVAVTLERISEGVVARGSVGATWAAECSACLRDLSRRLEVHVDELFEPQPVDGETYPIHGHEIDLEQLVRDNVLLELPLSPRCEDECIDLPRADIDPEPDPRWAALSELEL
jgi:uncharacterized protein